MKRKNFNQKSEWSRWFAFCSLFSRKEKLSNRLTKSQEDAIFHSMFLLPSYVIPLAKESRFSDVETLQNLVLALNVVSFYIQEEQDGKNDRK